MRTPGGMPLPDQPVFLLRGRSSAAMRRSRPQGRSLLPLNTRRQKIPRKSLPIHPLFNIFTPFGPPEANMSGKRLRYGKNPYRRHISKTIIAIYGSTLSLSPEQSRRRALRALRRFAALPATFSGHGCSGWERRVSAGGGLTSASKPCG
jgi:hypothetical protein